MSGLTIWVMVASRISKFGAAGRAKEGDHVADVLHAGEVHQHALEPQTEPRMWRRAELAQLEVPPVGLFGKRLGPDLLEEDVVPFFALASADDLANARREDVHGAHGFTVVVVAHV